MEQKASLASLLPILLLFVVFYLFLIKPQQKKAQEQKKMIDELKVGDELVLTSGIICQVDEIPNEKDYIFVRLNDKNIVRIFKDAIMGKYEENKKENTQENKKLKK